MEMQIILVLLVLLGAIVLFVTERFRVDIVAVIIMLSLAWLGLITPLQAFSGFASNAVISIIAVMILGYGIDRTGIMNRLARYIAEMAGSNEKRLLGTVSGVVGIISAFMQNIGSAALFLPAMLRISRRTGIPSSRLLMPMGFAAILGGCLSMVGSSPLIILNDLMRQGDLEPFGLFSVTPIGFALLGMGILYFLLFGSRVLPRGGEERKRGGYQAHLMESWELPSSIHLCRIPEASPIAGKEREELSLRRQFRLYLVAIVEAGDILYAPWRHTTLAAGQVLALFGADEDVQSFVRYYDLEPVTDDEILEQLGVEEAGFTEIVVRPRAPAAGKTFRDLAFRKNYGVEPVVLLGKGGEERDDFSDQVLSPGDIILIYGPWKRIRAISQDPSFMLFTSVEGETLRKSKAPIAVLCFLGGILLTLSGVQISLGLLSGAIAMVLTGVITIDEAYRAIDWRTIFLLAGLIPLGLAMESSGAAAFLADTLLAFLVGGHPLLIMTGIAVLTTFFTLFMSNVAATVILVPLVLIIGPAAGIDPRGLALLVGVCASNSFVLPTHQVNAFLMSPGGYQNSDYLKAGGIMTALFILVAVASIYLLFPVAP